MKYMLIKEPPTVPQLTADLAGFRKYLDSVGDFQGKESVERFYSHIARQIKEDQD